MGRQVLARIRNHRDTTECTAALIFDDATQELVDAEVANSLNIGVTLRLTDPRDGRVWERPIPAGTTRSLTTAMRGQIALRALRRIPFNSTEARTWTEEQLAARVEILLIPDS